MFKLSPTCSKNNLLSKLKYVRNNRNAKREPHYQHALRVISKTYLPAVSNHVLLLFCAILKIWEVKSSSQLRAFFLPDVCQLSSRKNDVGSLEEFLPRMPKVANKIPKMQKKGAENTKSAKKGEKAKNAKIVKIGESETVRFLGTFKIWVFFGWALRKKA